MNSFKFDNLKVQRYLNRAEMGKASGEYAISIVKLLLEKQDTVNILFAAAPSQNEVLATFMNSNLDFTRINALHMDEYFSLPQNAKQCFSQYLNEHAFHLKQFKSVFYIGTSNNADKLVKEYEKVVKDYPLDLAFIGLGENGHIAFNDPHVADFNDPYAVKVVTLDDICRQQQVNDGAFAHIDEVPKEAITLTIPTIMAAKYLVCTVPTDKKAWAVKTSIYGEISSNCPGSILRTHKNCILFCDENSGKDIK